MKHKCKSPNAFLKEHPTKYIMVTYEFGAPVYIAPLSGLKIQTTVNLYEAEIWSEMDTTPTKLNYHKAYTGYQNLMFKEINREISDCQ